MLFRSPYEAIGHEMVGARAAEVVDELVTVGELGHLIAAAARQAGLKDEHITETGSTQEAVELLRPRLVERDIVLVKGSHGMRMDRIVADLEYR